MDIGTAKIMPEEMDGVTHYLIDVIEPQEDFHVVRFKEMVLAAMEEIYNKGKIPIIESTITPRVVKYFSNLRDFTQQVSQIFSILFGN